MKFSGPRCQLDRQIQDNLRLQALRDTDEDAVREVAIIIGAATALILTIVLAMVWI